MSWGWLPVYSAIVATIAVCWNIYNIRRDRRSVKVGTTFAIPTYQDRLGAQHIVIEAMNNGRRPVTITSAGFHLSNNYNVFYMANASDFPPTPLPSRLNENEKVSFFFHVQGMKDSLQGMDAVIEYAWVEDATNKRHKGRITNSAMETFRSIAASPK